MKKILAITAVIGLSLQAQAAIVTWGSATNITADTDVITSGTLHGAYNIGMGAEEVVVNGVTFGITGATVAGAGWNDFGTAAGLSANYGGELLKKAMYSVSSFTMTGLSIGQEYRVQVWVQNVNGTGVTSNFDDGQGLSNFTVSASQWDNPYGQYVVGTFTADNALQSVVLSQTGGGGAQPDNARIMNAYSVYAIPEPSTFGLLGISALGIMLARRMRI